VNKFLTREKNKRFVRERLELDGHAYEHCAFEECPLLLEKGETEPRDCAFNHCQIVLLGAGPADCENPAEIYGEKAVEGAGFRRTRNL